MRFISLLLNSNTNTNNDGNTMSHVYDYNLYNKYQILNHIYTEDKRIEKYYTTILNIIHPFNNIRNTIQSSFITKYHGKELKITNAFMKMYEFLMFLDSINVLKTLINNNTLHMYDIAGAPGMFILCAEYYLKHNYSDTTLDWYSCSLESHNALKDSYCLFKNNPERYESCNVLISDDLQRVINNNKSRKFTLVTGDIGTEYDYDKLQEIEQLNLEWGQMILALNLVCEHGCMFLKMYSMVTTETLYLLDTITMFFDKVYICKPFTSKILNNESYIVCINRNTKNINTYNIPLNRPKIKDGYDSININVVKSFENSRINSKLMVFSLVSRYVINKEGNANITELMNNEIYKSYFNEFLHIYETMRDVK